VIIAAIVIVNCNIHLIAANCFVGILLQFRITTNLPHQSAVADTTIVYYHLHLLFVVLEIEYYNQLEESIKELAFAINNIDFIMLLSFMDQHTN